MNQEQFLSLLRTILQVAGGALVTKGYVDDATMQATIGAILTIGATAWGIYARRDNGLVESAAAVPGVTEIRARPDIAQSVPARNVVSDAPVPMSDR